MLFADFLNYAMEQADLTNYKLAKRLNISQTTVANWLAGITEPREKKRAEVLTVFGVDEHALEIGIPKIHYKEDQKENPAPVSAGFSPEDIRKLLNSMTTTEIATLMADAAEELKRRG